MTNHKHPITPPLEVVQQWWTDAQTLESNDSQEIRFIANVAARWGADQELEACCELMGGQNWTWPVAKLRAARRPKPPSLKEQAQAELDRLIALIPTEGAMAMAEPIRKALEALPND